MCLMCVMCLVCGSFGGGLGAGSRCRVFQLTSPPFTRQIRHLVTRELHEASCPGLSASSYAMRQTLRRCPMSCYCSHRRCCPLT